jgi:hypothetical protein
MARIEIDLIEAGQHIRLVAALEPQEDGTHLTTLPTAFGPLLIRLGEPVEAATAAEPEPAGKPAKAGARR